MRPREGRTSPAIAFTSVVFPEPERPKSAVMGASAAKRASSENDWRERPTSISSMGGGGARAPREPLGQRERGEREDHREDGELERLRVLSRHLRVGVDRER